MVLVGWLVGFWVFFVVAVVGFRGLLGLVLVFLFLFSFNLVLVFLTLKKRSINL